MKAILLTTILLTGVSVVAGQLDLPREFKPQYELANTRRVDFSGAHRLVLYITVPQGLSKADVANNILHAIAKHGDGMHAVSANVYETGDSLDVGFTVAQGEFAPHGDWSKALDGKRDPQRKTYQMKLQYKDGYFKAESSTQNWYGLTRTQRNALCAELQAAGMRASNQAMERAQAEGFSDIKKQWEREQVIKNELQPQYEAAIAKRYGVTPEQAREIWSAYLEEKFQ